VILSTPKSRLSRPVFLCAVGDGFGGQATDRHDFFRDIVTQVNGQEFGVFGNQMPKRKYVHTNA
jgi:hypothetical protein